MSCRVKWALLLTANVLGWCLLTLSQATTAAPPKGEMPAANPAVQRIQMIAELTEIKELLKEQNSLLRSGTLKVVVSEAEKR